MQKQTNQILKKKSKHSFICIDIYIIYLINLFSLNIYKTNQDVWVKDMNEFFDNTQANPKFLKANATNNASQNNNSSNNNNIKRRK